MIIPGLSAWSLQKDCKLSAVFLQTPLMHESVIDALIHASVFMALIDLLLTSKMCIKVICCCFVHLYNAIYAFEVKLAQIQLRHFHLGSIFLPIF